jgi:hypothetical protein
MLRLGSSVPAIYQVRVHAATLLLSRPTNSHQPCTGTTWSAVIPPTTCTSFPALHAGGSSSCCEGSTTAAAKCLNKTLNDGINAARKT